MFSSYVCIATLFLNENIMLLVICYQVTAVFAADAVARLSGVVGVAAVTAGPGNHNIWTSVWEGLEATV